MSRLLTENGNDFIAAFFVMGLTAAGTVPDSHRIPIEKYTLEYREQSLLNYDIQVVASQLSNIAALCRDASLLNLWQS